MITPEAVEELNHAADMMIPLLPSGHSVVVCADDMEVTDLREYANGTQVYTLRKIKS